jgi:DNA mismatch repair protein MSH5
VEASGGLFQIRPHKDFSSTKGRDRLLSLRLLSDLSVDESFRDPSPDMDASTSESAPRNAYDFMRRRAVKDPVVKRWNASIRLANSVSVESSPFCVSGVYVLTSSMSNSRKDRFCWSIARPPGTRTCNE